MLNTNKANVINEQGFLSKELLDLFKKNRIDEDCLPYFDNITHYGYNKDWNAIGGELIKIQFSNNPDVVKWLIRLCIKIFHPEVMVRTSMQTDFVQLRIAAAMIDKLNMPYQDKYMLFDNMQFIYHVRKKVFIEFHFTYIEQLPF